MAKIIDITSNKRHIYQIIAIYLLLSCTLFSPVFVLLALALTYFFHDDSIISWLDSHYIWARNTALIGSVGLIVGWFLLIVLIGWLVVMATYFTVLCRALFGLWCIAHSKPIRTDFIVRY